MEQEYIEVVVVTEAGKPTRLGIQVREMVHVIGPAEARELAASLLMWAERLEDGE